MSSVAATTEYSDEMSPYRRENPDAEYKTHRRQPTVPLRLLQPTTPIPSAIIPE